jgi:hypothetical protein
MSGGGSPLSIRSPNFFAYTNALASIYRSAPWLPEQDYALAQDSEVWEKLQLDVVVKGAIQTRQHKIAGRRSELSAPQGGTDADKRLADICQEGCLEAIDNLPQAKLNLTKAVFLGRTYGYIESERMPLSLGGGPVLDWWTPVHITDIDRRRVRYVPRHEPAADGSLRILSPWTEVSDLTISTWTKQAPDVWRNYVQLLYDDDESRLQYGRGIIGAVYVAQYARWIVAKHGLQGIEKLAQGVLLGTIDLERPGSVGKTNAAIAESMVDTLSKMRDASNCVVVGKGEDIELLFPNGEGLRSALEWIRYYDECLERLITGAPLTTGTAVHTGSGQRAETEKDQSEDVIQYDANQLDDAISRGLIGQFVRMNRGNLARMGLGAARRPRLVPQRETRQTPKEAAEVAEVLNRFIDLKKSEVYEKTGFSMPTQEDFDSGNVIEVTQAPALDPFGADPNADPFGTKPAGGKTGHPPLDRARGLVDQGLRRKGREALDGEFESEVA